MATDDDSHSPFTSASEAEWYDGSGAPMCRAAYLTALPAFPEFSAAAATSGAAILDLCCGTGVGTMELLKGAGAGAAITAVDLNEPMLEVFKKKLPGGAPVTVGTADALTLADLPDGNFNVVLSLFGSPWVFDDRADRVRALQQARRVLAPGGVFLFSTWRMADTEVCFSTDDDAKAELRDAGWDVCTFSSHENSFDDLKALLAPPVPDSDKADLPPFTAARFFVVSKPLSPAGK